MATVNIVGNEVLTDWLTSELGDVIWSDDKTNGYKTVINWLNINDEQDIFQFIYHIPSKILFHDNSLHGVLDIDYIRAAVPKMRVSNLEHYPSIINLAQDPEEMFKTCVFMDNDLVGVFGTKKNISIFINAIYSSR